MIQSTQKMIKDTIIEYLQDGREHTVGEIKCAVERKGIVIEKESSKLRTALYYLKQENSGIINTEKGVYKYVPEKSILQINSSKYDLTDFEHIESSSRKSSYLVMGVMLNGTVTLNRKLLDCFEDGQAEVRLKKDCSQIALLRNGNGKIRFGKNGRIKNYDLVNNILKRRKKFPVYYVGEWDEHEQIWIGNITDNNPNIKKADE